MDTQNTKPAEPWNNFLGLHEGEMAEELAEYETYCIASHTDSMDTEALYEESLVGWLKQAESQPEAVRKAWWYSIGRHEDINNQKEVYNDAL